MNRNIIQNPILRGFHPDPSICRVGEDYYIATSTFEWFPGVLIHHSRDLVHWRPLTHALTRQSQLDMEGDLDSGGVWAPCLSYDNGTFYLIYTDVKSRQGAFKDTPNYLVTAPSIEGPWSEPLYLNSSGFDPSLFHDTDGRKWLINMLWDHRTYKNSFAGIVLQEYSTELGQLMGPVLPIYRGTELRLTEGPHLYHKDGWYYLITAEGGTQYDHAVTVARSRNIEGPYETDPSNPVLTSAGDRGLELQKAGHACLVQTHTDEWYMVHLCGRPVKDKYCNLGRETAIQRCRFTKDEWLALEDGGNRPSITVQGPNIPSQPFELPAERDDFNSSELDIRWSTLRVPADDAWLSLKERRGFLRLRGRESMSSMHRQSLVALRQQDFYCSAETEIVFEPEHFQQMAGLIVYYDTKDYVYLRISHDEELGKCLGIVRSKDGVYEDTLCAEVPLRPGASCKLKVVMEREFIQFYYNASDSGWEKIGSSLDISHLSDDFPSYIRFTGTFIGMCVQDLAGTFNAADFDYFEYKQ
ncbi:glycoside hydrolase family 43 protein [Paenibacillus crassostreae]|uniref:Beta-xylosidase n=1 Tax=Paenibacillus crassostreae TaxID=1763538 RepID=A0A167F8P6_9BACL|nr:glycoside hydrolase family 43 protein [Paenibacillus crassostreae]AOZ90925.1 glycoside hydrolase 43 family protein [Paenibacillus crassostreae]OAB76308.1 beta-xylosidase [Paenibacillus crassostreae]